MAVLVTNFPHGGAGVAPAVYWLLLAGVCSCIAGYLRRHLGPNRFTLWRRSVLVGQVLLLLAVNCVVNIGWATPAYERVTTPTSLFTLNLEFLGPGAQGARAPTQFQNPLVSAFSGFPGPRRPRDAWKDLGSHGTLHEVSRLAE